ncbi:hypothetical protein ERJ75_001579100 [Trypanosoma vivax]|nr:hypothetical protein ERJ75_001579100 [Trypanosoma vivax]
MGRMCTIANKLRVLQNNLTLLNTDARSMKKSVSEEEARAATALKNADGSSDMSPHVEEGFALAVRMTALLDRELERSSAQIEKVTASHAAGSSRRCAVITPMFLTLSETQWRAFLQAPTRSCPRMCALPMPPPSW